MSYPKVAGEFETVAEIVRTGKSIARFGDGEIKALEKGVYTRELVKNSDLQRELRDTLHRPHKNCLLGIPTMDPKGDKIVSWLRSRDRYLKHFTGGPYYSAFITRPDCGTKWMETHDYYKAVVKIWEGKNPVAMVAEKVSKLAMAVKLTNTVIHIPCPMYGAYAVIDQLEKRVVDSKCAIALLSCGVTATCLANRLSKRGIQAIDIGSIGGFLLRWRTGAPKPTNYSKERENGPEDHT